MSKEKGKEIKGLINPDLWIKQVEINKDDPYSKACVNVARNVMLHLDDFEGEFNIGYKPDMTTPHGIICHCDDQGGITGFMAGAAANLVANCHKLGWKFWLANSISQYDIQDKDTLKKRVDSLLEAEGIDVTREEAEEYVKGLITRYKERTPEEEMQKAEALVAGATEVQEDVPVKEHTPYGAHLIAQERTRQLVEEGWDSEHDDEGNDNGQLARAAACYALTPLMSLTEQTGEHPPVGISVNWPWDPKWWKPLYNDEEDQTPDEINNRIRELTKAGALIAAEIDRLQRKKDKCTDG